MSVSEEEFRALQRTVTTNLGEFAEKVDSIADVLANTRTPSKAVSLGSGRDPWQSRDASGEFLKAVMLSGSRNSEEQAIGRETLASLSRFVSQSEVSKAALGTTDATGGWVIPNAIVDTLIKPKQSTNIYRDLMTVIPGVTAYAVDIPFRSAAPGRAVIAAFGATKENVDLAYNGYSATMYTLARIHDISNQFLRQSAGAAEQDVLSELGNAMARGESWYISQGTGTTMPYGYQTALTNSPSTFTTTFAGASSSTIAGNFFSALATAAGDLLQRNRTPEAAVVSSYTYATALKSGADTAGFFYAGLNGNQPIPGFRNGTPIGAFGIPVVVDRELPSTDKSLYVGEWSAFRVYFGQNYRVDSSDVAGSRFDSNVTGFRGELEMAYDARPGVYAGALQKVTNAVP